MTHLTRRGKTTLVMSATILGLNIATLSNAQPQSVTPTKVTAASNTERSGIVPVRVVARLSEDSLVPRISTVGSVDNVGAKAVIALNLKGAPLQFSALPDNHQAALMTKYGKDAGSQYEAGLALQLKSLVNRFNAEHPTARVGVAGVPFAPVDADDASSNTNYSDLIGSVDVFLPGAGSERSDAALKALSEMARGRQIVPISEAMIERSNQRVNMRSARQAEAESDGVRPSRQESGTERDRNRPSVSIGGGDDATGSNDGSNETDSLAQRLGETQEQDAINALIAAWGSSNPDWDMNGDGIVDGFDLSIVLGHYGDDEGEGGGGGGGEGGGGQGGGGGEGGGGEGGGGSGGGSGEGIQDLVPGSGFIGVTSVPSKQGSPSAAGYDAESIARWTELPYITRDRDFYVTISAFHMEDISHIEFILDGGEPVVSTEVTPHPDTGYPEYMAQVDVSDLAPGMHEIRAIVYPNAGIPRVLQGAANETSIHMVNNGNESFWFNYDPNPTTAYVGPASQFATVDDAIAALGTDLYGGRIYLSEGNHDLFDDYNNTFTNTAQNKVLTISAAPGLDATKVFVEGYSGIGDGMLRNGSLHLRNVSVLAPVVDHGQPSLKGYGNNRLFIEGVYNTSTDPVRGWANLGVQRLANATTEWGLGCWIKDSTFVNVPKGIKSPTLVKNTSFTRISADAFGSGPGAVVNCWLDKADSPNADHAQHADIFQISVNQQVEHVENRIFVDIRATNNTNQIGHISGSVTLKNFAFVRWRVDSMYTSSSMNFFHEVDHVVIDDNIFRNCSISFIKRMPHALFRDTLMWRFREGNQGFDGIFTPSQVIVDNVHFTNDSSVPFQGSTIGEVNFASPSPPVGVPSNGSGGFIPTYVMTEAQITNQYLGNANVDVRGTVRDHFYYDKSLLDLTWWR